MDPTICYVSAPPGAGKTTAAVRHVVDHLVKGYHGEGEDYLLYVTPTIELRNQTLGNVVKELEKRFPSRPKLVRRLYSKVHAIEAEKNREPTVVQALDILNEVPDEYGKYRPFGFGSVLFVTHATFLLLSNHPKFKYTHVIFDESRKWIDQPHSVPIEGPVRALFDELFETSPWSPDSDYQARVLNAAPYGVDLNIKLQRKRRELGVERMKRLGIYVREEKPADLLTVKARAIPPKKMSRLQTKYRLQNETAFDYLKDAYDRLRTHQVDVYAIVGATKIIQMEMPRRPFEKFKTVHVLSADFETSQMFCMLIDQGCRLINVTEKYIVRKFYLKALEQIRQRNRKITIRPLLSGTIKPPSMEFFRSGLIAPLAKMKALDQAFKDCGWSTPTVRKHLAYFRNPAKVKQFDHNHVDSRMKPLLSKHRAVQNPLDWMLHACVEEYDQWIQENPQRTREDGKRQLGVMFYNERFKPGKEIAKRVDTRFVTKSMGLAEGDNDNRLSNCVAFLSSLNPYNEMKALLEARFGYLGYSAEEDYVIDKAVQCAGRGCVREKEIEDPMLILVSNEFMAERLQDRYKRDDAIDRESMVKRGSYAIWDRELLAQDEETIVKKAEERRATDREAKKVSRADADRYALEKAKRNLANAVKNKDLLKQEKWGAEVKRLTALTKTKKR